MARTEETEQPFPSTTWQWKLVRMGRPPEASSTARAKRARRYALPRRNPREPLTVIVRFRGGAECWWELTARGQVWRAPGYVSLHDVMSRINSMGGQ